MRKGWILVLALTVLLPVCSSQATPSPRPAVLIYSPKAPGYGNALRRIIEEDGRFSDARVRVCTKLEDFRVAMFFPDVKVAVVTLTSDVGQDINSTLQWFFGEGGGLVGMGFAGSAVASLNASETVFPAFGNTYITPQYNPALKRFIMNLTRAENDAISEGIPSFTVPQHKLILHSNPDTKQFERRLPESGEYKVLFTEESSGAPAMIKYRDEGVSVTFTTFGGDDVERGPSYQGLFVDQPEFKALFTNALFWAWSNEDKLQGSLERATEYYQRAADHLDEVLRAAEDAERTTKLFRLIKDIGVILGACIGCLATYWATFVRPSRSR